MSTGLKVVLWIVGILAGLVALLVVGGYFFGRSMMGDLEATKEFAKNATHEQCTDEFAKRINACDGMTCMIRASAFGGGCLAEAKGDFKEYCAAVPQTSDRAGIKSWSAEFCAKHGITGGDTKCTVAASAIVGACGSVNKNR